MTHYAVTLAKARQLLDPQVGFGGGYNRQGARPILGEVARERGQEVADRSVRELRLDGHIIQPVKLQELARWK